MVFNTNNLTLGLIASYVVINLCLSDDSSNGGPIQTWFLADATLSTASQAKYVVYDESFNPDCIYVFGGYSCQTCFQCYNINYDTITTLGTLSLGGYSLGQIGAVSINGKIYYLRQNGQVASYDISTALSSTVFSITSTDDGCLTKHPNNGQLYVVRGSSSTTFYIYDISSNSLTAGPSLQKTRHAPSCIVNEYENDPHLYVIGGDQSQIERINLNVLDKWEILIITLDDDYFATGSTFDCDTYCMLMSIVSFNQYIYLIGGQDGGYEDDIYYLDVENWKLYFAGVFPLSSYRIASIWCPLTKRIYTFGGRAPTGSYYSTIYYSNEAYFIPSVAPSGPPILDPADKPSKQPTSNPTIQPVIDPTIEPTIDPSIHPSNNPTIEPTINPTIDPSTHPTTIPTIDPTSAPSVRYDPTSMPRNTVDVPSMNPTTVPSNTPADFPTIHPTMVEFNTTTRNGSVEISTSLGSKNTTQHSIFTTHDQKRTSRVVTDTMNNNSYWMSTVNQVTNVNVAINANNDENVGLTMIVISSIIGSVVIFICCCICICLFGVSVWYCYKKDNIKYKIVKTDANDEHVNDQEKELGNHLSKNNVPPVTNVASISNFSVGSNNANNDTDIYNDDQNENENANNINTIAILYGNDDEQHPYHMDVDKDNNGDANAECNSEKFAAINASDIDVNGVQTINSSVTTMAKNNHDSSSNVEMIQVAKQRNPHQVGETQNHGDTETISGEDT